MESDRKVAIVTGGASGIGRAICKELAAENVFVIIADINEQDGKRVETELNHNGEIARFVPLNVTDYENVESVITDIYEGFGRLDYLFNNAGIAMYGELYDMKLENWKEIIDINVWGVIHGTQVGYSIMKDQGFGHIVNTSSASGLGPSPISSLCPAFVDTPIFSKAKAINESKDK